MFCLFFLIAIVAVLAQGEEDCTLYKYATVNTFKTEKSFSFSCYGIGTDCEVYYAPLGSGCNGGSLTLINTVPENETQVLTFDEGFELGGRFCSNNQIGVYYVDGGTGNIVSHLPRATEAGTKFHAGLVTSSKVTQCVASALSLRATVRVTIDSDVKELNIDPYTFHQFKTTPSIEPDSSLLRVMIESDNPVIISCARIDSNRLVTLQPVSHERLVVNAGVSNSVSVIITHCSTNALIQNFSKVNFISINENSTPCDVAPSNIGDPNGMTPQGNCVFFVEPLEDACVGMLLFAVDDGALVTMGIPDSKLSTRFVNYPEVDSFNLISFSAYTCTGFVGQSNEEQIIYPEWESDNPIGMLSFGSSSNPIADFSWTVCDYPVFLVSREDTDERIPFLSGYQSEELWQPYFDSICTPSPPSPPSIFPSSADAHSLVTSWVVFFAVYLLSSRFLV